MITRQALFLSLSLALTASMGVIHAAEHPKEHPTTSGGKVEHSTASAKKGEHPKEHPTTEEKAKQKDIKEKFSAAIEEYVENESQKADGFFVVHDDKLDKDWNLKLIRIHKKNIAQLAEDRFFACADFKGKQKGSSRIFSTKLDLDFYVRKVGDGWDVEEVLIHKVKGKPRFTYDKNNNRVPVKG